MKQQAVARQAEQTAEAEPWSSLMKKTESTSQDLIEMWKGKEYNNKTLPLSNHFHFQYKNKIIAKK
jgi:hypothetical protein